MKVLYLGNFCGRILDFLSQDREVDRITISKDKLSMSDFLEIFPDFIVSYGYHYIIGGEVIGLFKGRIINLHISYLPYNRGADPNFWSFADDTKKGVTIHSIDENLDTGEILLQAEIEFSAEDTLKTSYNKLQNKIQDLFIENWEDLKNGAIVPKRQEGGGTYHRSADKAAFSHLLTKGWDTPVKELCGCGKGLSGNAEK